MGLLSIKTLVAAVLGFASLANGLSLQLTPTAGDLEFANPSSNEVKPVLFTGASYTALVTLTWADSSETIETDRIYWELYINGEYSQSGSELINGSQIMPSSITVGTVEFDHHGVPTLEAYVSVYESMLMNVTTASATPSVIGRGVSLIPLILTLIVAILTKRVELSLYFGVFWGAFIANQFSFRDAFKRSLDTYILEALSDEDHQYVVLFTLFLSGLVGMMEKSGGVVGLTKSLIRFAKNSRAAQLLGFLAGILIFFDDYANALVVGSTMRPIMDDLMVSREKLAFIVDATSAPIASLFPISSWTGYEAGLINTELQRIITNHGGVPDGFPETGYGLLLQSIPYRFYEFFMIIFNLSLIISKREFGPMLVAERKVRIYSRRDGGDGANKAIRNMNEMNQPREDQPERAWNMLVPVLFLVFFIFFVFVHTGVQNVDDPNNYTVGDVFLNADSYSGLLFGTFGTCVLCTVFYQLQFRVGDQVLLPTWGVIKSIWRGDEDRPRPLFTIYQCVDAWTQGLMTIFPALIVLTLAWATGSMMTDVGADALFYQVIIDNDLDTTLPAITFCMSFVIALSTGTSWGTMAIMFPLVIVPAFDVSDGNKVIVLGTISGVLSGAVAGDHSSIISDTTVLSSTATQCDVWRHFITQFPYVLFVFLVALLLGYLPTGTGSYPAGAGIVIGALVLIICLFSLSVPVEHPNGTYDVLTETYMKLTRNEDLKQLMKDTITFVSDGAQAVSRSAIMPNI